MPTNQQNNNSKKNQLNSYARYAGMGFQMGVIMFAFTYGGYRLDKHFQFKIPVFTLSLALISIFAALYLTLKDFLKKK